MKYRMKPILLEILNAVQYYDASFYSCFIPIWTAVFTLLGNTYLNMSFEDMLKENWDAYKDSHNKLLELNSPYRKISTYQFQKKDQ